MKFLYAVLLPVVFQASALAGIPINSESVHKVITATTNAYPGERTEIWVQCNAKSELVAVILEEYSFTEPLRRTHLFTLEQVNSAEGAILKTEFTVALLTLKGRDKGLGLWGGSVDLEFRKSNWFSDTGKIPLFLKRYKDTWRAYSPDSNGKAVSELRIQVWTGFGFGIDGIEVK